MRFIIYIKKGANVNRIADYITSLPAQKDFEDVLDYIEPDYEEGGR